MRLEWLRISHVRNLGQTRIEPGPGLNIFTGRNASGKTAILEAIYLLARARSFRTPRIREVVSHTQPLLQVSAGVAYGGSRQRATTGIEKGRGQILLRYNGNPVKTVSEQARHLPLVLVTPDSHRLLTGTPKQRRHWLDWAMFHVEPDYLKLWRDYFRALRNRNSLLKTGVRSASHYLGWEKTLAETGGRLNRMREGFVRALSDELEKPPAATLGGPPVTLSIEPGWPAQTDLAEILADGREGDILAGYSRFGPHRADLTFVGEGGPVSKLFSRGQIKLFVCRLIMAQARVLQHLTGESPLFLLDDYIAELDSVASEALLDGLAEQGWQCFLNATDFREQGRIRADIQRFHVEHGQVIKMVK